MKKNHFTLFPMKFYGYTLILSPLGPTSVDLYDFEKNPFCQICPLRAVFRSSQVVLFFFEPAPSHQFWSDLQKLTFVPTSWPIWFVWIVRMVARLICLGGVAPDKYMVLLFWDGGSSKYRLIPSTWWVGGTLLRDLRIFFDWFAIRKSKGYCLRVGKLQF